MLDIYTKFKKKNINKTKNNAVSLNTTFEMKIIGICQNYLPNCLYDLFYTD